MAQLWVTTHAEFVSFVLTPADVNSPHASPLLSAGYKSVPSADAADILDNFLTSAVMARLTLIVTLASVCYLLAATTQPALALIKRCTSLCILYSLHVADCGCVCAAELASRAATFEYAETVVPMHKHLARRHLEPLAPLQLRFFGKTVTLHLAVDDGVLEHSSPELRRQVDHTRFLRGHVDGQEQHSSAVLYAHGHGDEMQLEGDITLVEDDGTLGHYRLDAVHDDSTDELMERVAVFRAQDLNAKLDHKQLTNCHGHDHSHDHDHDHGEEQPQQQKQQQPLLSRRQAQQQVPTPEQRKAMPVARIGFVYHPDVQKVIGRTVNLREYIADRIRAISHIYENNFGVRLAPWDMAPDTSITQSPPGDRAWETFFQPLKKDNIGFNKTGVALLHYLSPWHGGSGAAAVCLHELCL